MKEILLVARCAGALVAVAATAASGIGPENHYILCPTHCEALSVPIEGPNSVTTDARGDVYFSATHVVFRLDGQGMLARLAGDGTWGFSGDGGPAIDAKLDIPNSPQMLAGGLSVDVAGNIFVADTYNGRVRKINPAGIITSVADRNTPWSPGEERPASERALLFPEALAADAWGNVYISDDGMVKRLGPDATMSSITRNRCDDSSDPGVCPNGVALDYSGNVYVSGILADVYATVVAIRVDGSRVTVAGGAPFSLPIDGALGARTALGRPLGVAVGPAGDLYIADELNNCVLRVDGAGIIRTVAGLCRGGWSGFSGDGGLATSARLNHPHGVAVDAAGNVYIADTDNNRIRKVTPDGIITTVAGNGDVMPQEERGEDVK